MNGNDDYLDKGGMEWGVGKDADVLRNSRSPRMYRFQR